MTIAMCDDNEYEQRQQDPHPDREDHGQLRPHFTFDTPQLQYPFSFVQAP